MFVKTEFFVVILLNKPFAVHKDSELINAGEDVTNVLPRGKKILERLHLFLSDSWKLNQNHRRAYVEDLISQSVYRSDS